RREPGAAAAGARLRRAALLAHVLAHRRHHAGAPVLRGDARADGRRRPARGVQRAARAPPRRLRTWGATKGPPTPPRAARPGGAVALRDRDRSPPALRAPA